MAGKIKGITLEIDGNSTKLVDALDKPKKRSQELQSSLKDVDKALKLDPTNVDLVAQKQRLLTKAISSTEDELKILKEAQKQYIESGKDIDGQEYTELVGKIATTERSLNNLKNKQKEFNNETDELNQKIKLFGENTVELKGKLDVVDKALKLDPKNIELLTQKQHLLSDSIDATKDELEALRESQQRFKEDEEALDSKAYIELENKIVETEQALKRLKDQQFNFSSEIQAMGIKLGEFGDRATKIGDNLTKYVSAPIIGAGAAAAGLSVKFEDSLAKVSTIADTTQVPLEELSDAITNLSNETGISADEIANNVYDAISAGQKTGDAVNFVANSTKLAKAGFAEAGDSLDLLTTIMNAYGLEAEEVNHVSDVLIQTQNLGKTTVGELSTAMGKVIPTANATNVSLDQLCAGYALMTANGVATAESTTYINSMLNELSKTGSSADKVLREKTGKSFSELMKNGSSLSDVLKILNDAASEDNKTLSDMFSSSEAGKAGLILLGDSADTFNNTLKEMQNSSGATNEAFEKLQTTSYSVQTAFNIVQNTFRELGDTLMQTLGPIIEQACQKIRDLCNWFSDLDDRSKNVVLTVGGIIASIGPLISISGRISKAMGSLINYFGSMATVGGKIVGFFTSMGGAGNALASVFGALVSPIGLVIAAIAGLVGAFATLWNTNEEFRNSIIAIWEEIQETVANFITRITDRIGDLGINFSNITAMIQEIWTEFCDFFAPVFEAAFQQVSNIVSYVLDTVYGVISTFIALVQLDWDGFWQGIQDIVDGAWGYVYDTIANVITLITSLITEFLSWFGIEWNADLDGILNIWKDIWKEISLFIDSILATIQELVAAFIAWINGDWDGFCNHLNLAWQNIWNSIKNFGQNIWNAIRSIFQSVWNDIKAKFDNIMQNIQSKASSIWNNIKGTAQNVWNGIKTAIVNPIQDAYNSVSNIFSNIKNSITNKINGAMDAVRNAIDRIRGFFHFSISWPYIPMPHPYVYPRGWKLSDLLHGSMPSIGIDWYAKAMKNGMILNSPTIFGMDGNDLLAGGEAGPEAVVGVQSLRSMIHDGLDKAFQQNLLGFAGANSGPVPQSVTIDYDRLAKAMIDGLSGTTITHVTEIDGRPVAKQITPLINEELDKISRRK